MVTEGYAWPMVTEPSETRTRYLVGNERADRTWRILEDTMWVRWENVLKMLSLVGKAFYAI